MKTEFDFNSSKLEDFFYWMDERHKIYCKRASGQGKPWTYDPILLDYKFTNVFRQLDAGTVALKEMMEVAPDTAGLDLVLFNIVWYRIFCVKHHCKDLGFVTTFEQLEKYVCECNDSDKQLWPGCYMTGAAGCLPGKKHIEYLKMLKQVWNERKWLVKDILANETLEHATLLMTRYNFIGLFLAYEIASDLRWYVFNPTDKLTWANIGPGAKRGLNRLGFLASQTSLQTLYRLAESQLSDNLQEHYDTANLPDTSMKDRVYPPFEMREIEHSLCEFDKYERTKSGAGTPRSKYPGRK